jgi:hypothetical protein
MDLFSWFYGDCRGYNRMVVEFTAIFTDNSSCHVKTFQHFFLNTGGFEGYGCLTPI